MHLGLFLRKPPTAVVDDALLLVLSFMNNGDETKTNVHQQLRGWVG